MRLGLVARLGDEEKIIFGSRVADPKEIQLGCTFHVYVRGDGWGPEYHIVGMPQRDSEGRLRVRVEKRSYQEDRWAEGEICLADFGLDPSHEEDWDGRMCLTRSRKICI